MGTTATRSRSARVYGMGSQAAPEPGARQAAIIATAGLGMLLSTLDTGIVNVALPTLERTFGTTAAGISWAVSGYIVALAGTVVVFGRIADRFGRVRVFAYGMVTFAAGSVCSALAVSAATLIAARALQGIGAAMLQATATALITTLVAPERRGAALGTLGMMIGVGPVLGPAVGGLLLSVAGWEWLFWINVPLCAVGIAVCRLLPDERMGGERVSYDAAGSALLGLAVVGVLAGLSLVPTAGGGVTLAAFGGAGVMLALFVAREASTSQPAVQLDLFRSARFSAALYCSLAFGAASAILFILPPFLLETQLGLRPWQVGLVAAIAPVGLVAASRWSGKRIEALGAQRLMTLGLALMLSALALLAITHRTVSPALIGPLLLVYGVGGGLFQPANIATVMAAESSDRQGTIGAVQRMAQNVGIALGATVGGAFLAAAEGRSAGSQLGAAAGAWLSAAVLVAVGLGAFVALARRRNTHAQLESQ